ncbi:MAG TPA: gliding motility-associated ABC transporter ATP-binding subunit GldA [Flavobacteriales bacterium]|jgi:ABC-2 type transport system ATP-binding protein|nr:gliding motility-associated ABC transporter ATP-binding subunit GldA [Salibacteraceae bacterium]HAS35602.1 gliding motility-associated ABC transporter ATP-binding subunit GldA [Flavobacteriales bacterium]
MSISVQHIHKVYGKQKALDDLSFEIGKGELVGFLGPNGAGKSTMMKILTSYISSTEGVVKVCGFNVDEAPLEVQKRIGYLPEHNPLYLDMYVREFLLFIAGIHKIKKKKERVEEVIELVGLTPESGKRISALSKGYRQRVGLAQAILHDPEVLILDEPTTGLDPNQILEIRQLIKDLSKEKTVMMSTHIMQEVEAICDRVLIVHEGKLVADKSVKELIGKSSAGQVIVMEFDSEIEESFFSELGLSKIEKIGEKEWRLSSESSEDLRPKLFQLAVDNKLSVLSMKVEAGSLEDVFKKLTKKA